MALHLSKKELEALGIKAPGEKRKSKYNARKVKIDGIAFPSKAEADYYIKLKMLVKCGRLSGFCRQPRFIITEGQNGEKCTEYVADYIEFYPDGTYRIVDVKGVKTNVFKLKMKCLSEKYPNIKIELEE